MMHFWTIFLCCILLLAALVLLGSYICWRLVFTVPKSGPDILQLLGTWPPPQTSDDPAVQALMDRMNAMVSAAEALPYEDVTIVNRSGLHLHGRYYHTADGAPLQIMVHGYHSTGLRDFCGGLQMALKSGCNVLLVDQRAHGESEGRCLSFGILERWDCLDWISYARERFGENTPIFLVGISMGGASVLMTADLPLPSNVVGIIDDCGYTSPAAILRKVMAGAGFPFPLLYPLVWLGARVFGGFRLGDADSLTALRHAKVPVLFIHGEDDHFVPCSMGISNYEACTSEKRLLTVPGANHGRSYLEDEAAYTKAVNDFMALCLAAPRASV